jgi:3-deoxy-D-manno-octulosonic-acid transferase
LLIAPRHPERFDEVAALLDANALTWTRRTRAPSALDATCDAVLLDSIGELRAVYPLARLVFVGGSIARKGGHNVLEAAVAGRCVITGAHTHNFAAIVRAFLEREAIVQLPEMAEAAAPSALARVFADLLANNEQREAMARRAHLVLEGNRGATQRTIELLTPLFAASSESSAADQR